MVWLFQHVIRYPSFRILVPLPSQEKFIAIIHRVLDFLSLVFFQFSEFQKEASEKGNLLPSTAFYIEWSFDVIHWKEHKKTSSISIPPLRICPLFGLILSGRQDKEAVYLYLYPFVLWQKVRFHWWLVFLSDTSWYCETLGRREHVFHEQDFIQHNTRLMKILSHLTDD